MADGVFRPIWTDTRTGDTQIFTAAVGADATALTIVSAAALTTGAR